MNWAIRVFSFLACVLFSFCELHPVGKAVDLH